MHLDRVIVCTDIWYDGIHTRPDDPNTLTHQSSATNDAPRNPLYVPIIWNPDWTRPGSTLHLWLWYWHFRRSHNFCDHRRHVTNLQSDVLFIIHKHLHQHRIFFQILFPYYTHIYWFEAYFPIRLPFSDSGWVVRECPLKFEKWNNVIFKIL